MKQIALVLALVAVPALALADAPEHVLNDSGQEATFDCGKGGKVVVNGANNRVAIRGGCIKVLINGAQNQVAIESADRIAINGAGNEVLYHRGWTRKAPKIANTGVGNKIARKK